MYTIDLNSLANNHNIIWSNLPRSNEKWRQKSMRMGPCCLGSLKVHPLMFWIFNRANPRVGFRSGQILGHPKWSGDSPGPQTRLGPLCSFRCLCPFGNQLHFFWFGHIISLFRKLVSFPNNKHKGAEPWQPMAFHGSLEHCFNWTVACPETVSQNHVRITVLGVWTSCLLIP